MALTLAQLEFRRSGIGSSDIPAIAGLNRYRAPIDVWLDKTGRAPLQTPENMKMRLGSMMEPVIARLYEEAHGLQEQMEQGETVRSSTEPWMVASPDRLYRTLDGAGDWKVVELKRVGTRMAWAWEAGPPDYVAAQVLWQLDVTGIRMAAIAALVDDEFVQYEQPWLPDVAESLREIARDFWVNHVQADKPPAIDASEGWSSYLASKWPRELLPVAEASEEANEIAFRMLALKAEIKEREEAADLAGNELKALIQDAAGMRGSGWSVSWKFRKGSPRYKDIAEALGASAEQVDASRGPGTRVFAIKEG